MSFGKTILNQSIKTMLSYVIWILIDLFIINIKTEDSYKDIADDVGKGFDTSNYECNYVECNRPLPAGKNKKLILI